MSNLKKYREQAGATQSGLADLVGMVQHDDAQAAPALGCSASPIF